MSDSYITLAIFIYQGFQKTKFMLLTGSCVLAGIMSVMSSYLQYYKSFLNKQIEDSHH